VVCGLCNKKHKNSKLHVRSVYSRPDKILACKYISNIYQIEATSILLGYCLARLIHEVDGAASFQTFLEAEKATRWAEIRWNDPQRVICR
jgi:hypothetical protein